MQPPNFRIYAPAPPPYFVEKKYGRTVVRKHTFHLVSDKGCGEIWNNFQVALDNTDFVPSQSRY